ncbi:trypsin CFT-1-like [Trichoplusia ni]|uniref:Trypsin CFT-1-like n=1 Tax=Trichoplusia ni TaxID=7111 RepID=A0A7E5VY09_TRINI|nr:trypsin CFT-1-like [Trichoplusia ni]XP_026733134.1 trypsin CFT-1-like [Trichoplusia ni]
MKIVHSQLWKTETRTMRGVALLAFCLAAVAAVPSTSRLSDKSLSTIDQYPSSASILSTWDDIALVYVCAGVIINNRSILTAGHCMYYRPPSQYRVRIGSSYTNSGGQVLPALQLIIHPDFNDANLHSDLSIVRTPVFTYSHNIRPAPIAGYNLADDLNVWATSWRQIEGDRQISEEQVVTISNDLCRTRFDGIDAEVTSDVVCTRWPNQEFNGYCSGFGSGIYQSGILVAVHTNCFGSRPAINIRVANYTSWIQSNA